MDTPSSPTTETSPSAVSEGPRSTVSEVVEKYTQVFQYYKKVSSSSNIPMPSLIYAEACVKISRFLLTVYANDGWSDSVLSLLVQGKISGSSTDHGSRFLSMEDHLKHKKSGIARQDIGKWVTKIWEVHLDEMSLLDQVKKRSR